MLAYDGSFGKLREVFGVLWDAALLSRTSTGLEYSDSIGGCGVTVRVSKGDRIHFWEGFSVNTNSFITFRFVTVR